MFPFLAARIGSTSRVRCPNCGKVQSASKGSRSVKCRDCGRTFDQSEGRESLRTALARAKRRKQG